MIVVVIDDVQDLAEILVMLLRAEGYAASYALSGKSGLAMVSHLGAHAVLLDYMLPDLNGAEVGLELRRTTGFEGVKILMYTSTPEEVVRPIFDGYDAFLSKPVLHDRLVRALDAALTPDDSI